MFHAAHPRAHEVTRDPARQLAPIALAPEAAMDEDRDRVRAVAGGHEQLTELGRDALRTKTQAATPIERTASASRETPSSIWSGVTPE